jgi:hypothetical protein
LVRGVRSQIQLKPVDTIAPVPDTGDSTLAVRFDLPRGWVELPAPGQRPQGLLRRSPYELLARRLVANGSVTRTMTEPTAAYLERVASADPGVIGIATYIEVPSRNRHTFVTFAVFPGPKPDLDGDADGEVLAELAARPGDDRESPRVVEPAELPWGRAARATYTRDRPGGWGDPRPFVQYWVQPHGIDHLVILLGDVDAPPDEPTDAHISDIDSLARTLWLSPA